MITFDEFKKIKVPGSVFNLSFIKLNQTTVIFDWEVSNNSR